MKSKIGNNPRVLIPRLIRFFLWGVFCFFVWVFVPDVDARFCWMKRWLIRMMCGFSGFWVFEFSFLRFLGFQDFRSWNFGVGVGGFCGFGDLALDSVLWFPDLLWFVVSFRFVFVLVVLVYGFASLDFWFWKFDCLWLLMVALSFWGLEFLLGLYLVGFVWICLYVFLCRMFGLCLNDYGVFLTL